MSALPCIGFVLVVLLTLAVDLGVFHRRSHVVRASEAAVWTTVWVILALLFNMAVFYLYGHHVLGVGRESSRNPGRSSGEPSPAQDRLNRHRMRS